MLDIDSMIDAGKRALEERDPVEQDVIFGGRAVTVRVHPVDSQTWAAITEKCPPRLDVTRDMQFGYNVPAATAAYRALELVDGDEVDSLQRTNEEGVTTSRWPDVFAALSRPDQKNIEMAVWGLNEWDHMQALAAAGKASKGHAVS